MCKYQRMTLAVRCQIDCFLQAGFSIPEIARRVGYNKTSIYRELKRNLQLGKYTPSVAQLKSENRYKLCRKNYKITPFIATKIWVYLDWGWSPQQIAGRFKREKYISLSHECIYQFIYRQRRDLISLLRRPKKRGFSRYSRTRCLPKNGLPISDRPKIVDRRARFGDWERDLFFCANRKQILACTERKSRYSKLAKLGTATSAKTADKTEELILGLSRKAFSITSDNGTEFKGRKLKIPSYFCKPMSPQQRGTIENTIGLLRQYIKLKTNIDDISDEKLQEIENRLNFRPRKVLNYATPYEVFFNKKVALAT